jgi:N-carbamoylputrescine amidase
MSKLTIAGIQMGSYAGSYAANIEKAVEVLERTVAEHQPDVICFSEMMTGPYFCRIHDDSYFKFAEPVPGPTTETFTDNPILEFQQPRNIQQYRMYV